MADRFGIDDSYLDTGGNERHVAPGSIERLRGLIGEPPAVTSATIIVRPGEPLEVGSGELELEDGETITVDRRLPADLPLGYHRFAAPDGSSRRVISTPGRCYLPEGWRAWGWAVQLYAARSTASWGIGDLGDLARLTGWARRLGAGFVMINPVGAVAPTENQQPSPYFPASRRYRNPLYLRVEDVPGAARARDAVAAAARAGQALDERRTIDRDAVWRIKRDALEAIWAAGPPLADFDRWRAAQPPALEQFAIWSVLVGEIAPRWRDWPTGCRRPDGDGVAAFAEQHADRVRFEAWLQWLLDRQLAAASAGTAVIQDLPIGIDPDGFDAWTWQDILALDASVGAPPDEFNQRGQDWGLPPFIPWRLAAAGYAPFIETVRATLASGGGIRIDHVMGLFRLWWIPSGASPSAGAYVRYPAEDLLAILALESRRAGAVVVGEDLGTVEEHAREALADHDVLSYRLLWFEESDPRRWPAKTMAAVTTHDLPTVAGLWDGSDLEAQHRLGLDPNTASTEAIRARLASSTGMEEGTGAADAVIAAHALLARAPSVLLVATLDDAIAEPERPNIPGADQGRANWSLALPVPLEEIETHAVATRLARLLNDAIHPPDDSSEGVATDA
jgi:4-alpha-glucanotransferase